MKNIKCIGIITVKSNAEYTLALYKDDAGNYYHSTAGWGIDEGILMKREYPLNPPENLISEPFEDLSSMLQNLKDSEKIYSECENVEISIEEVIEDE